MHVRGWYCAWAMARKWRYTLARGSCVPVLLASSVCPCWSVLQSHECVVAVTERLQKMGIAGHQTTAGAERQVDKARSLMVMLKQKVGKRGVIATLLLVAIV